MKNILLGMIIFFVLFNKIILNAEEVDEALKDDQSVKPVNTKNDPISLSTKKHKKIEYANPLWNKDSKKIDTAIIILKDAKIGKIVEIVLQETEPDSAIFFGFFSIGWADIHKIVPRIYLPPQKLVRQKGGIKKINELISAGKIKRKPYVFREDEKGYELVDVYDTKEQALMAYKNYIEKKKIEKQQKELENNFSPRIIDDKSKLEAVKINELNKLKNQLAIETSNREAYRIRKEQLERRKALLRIEEQKKLMNESKRKKRIYYAKKLAGKALALYNQGKYLEAEKRFNKSMELDPENKNYYYQYAVTLYKNGNYNEALVFFRLLDKEYENHAEKNYYIGLAHLKLKEYPEAVNYFEKVKELQSNDENKIMASSSAFYIGIIKYSENDLLASKDEFQYVLDHSQDPKLDNRAEEYIEKIIVKMQFDEKKSKRLTLTARYDLIYDSNVLFFPEQLSSGQTGMEKEGIRNSFFMSLDYRALYTLKHELVPSISTLYMYTLDSSFQPDDDLQKADPWLTSFSLPYKYKGKLFNKGYFFKITPGYENLKMNTDSTGEQEDLLQSTYVNLDNTFIMTNNWFSSYNLSYRNDKSLDDVSSEVDDPTANKYSLTLSNIFFLNETKNKAYAVDLGYVINQATGSNYKYNKINLAVNYLSPLWSNMSWNAKISYYNSTYPEQTDSRKDANYSLTLGIIKPWKQWLEFLASISYTKNQSNIETYAYDKFTLTTALNFKNSF